MRRWKTRIVVFDGVSLFERLQQHEYQSRLGFYSEDITQDISSIQQTHGVSKNQSLTIVALWSSICKVCLGLKVALF